MPATGAIQCFIKQLEHQWEILEEAKIAKTAQNNNGRSLERNEDMDEKAESDTVQATEVNEMET